MNVIEIERKINTDISDTNLITYATEEDKWNDYVDKTIDFNKNYSIFTENKNKVDGNFETVTTNDNELSIILRNIRIKNAEINAVEREISRLDQEIIDAGKNQERIIKNASDDVLLDSYNLDLMRQDIIISNITDLNNYKNSTQTSLNVYSRYSNYKTKTTEEMTK